MARERVVDAVGRRVRLVHADVQPARLEAANERRRRDGGRGRRCTPTSHGRADAAIDRREAVDARSARSRGQSRGALRSARRSARWKGAWTAAMRWRRSASVSVEFPGIGVVSLIVGDEIGRVERPVAVDDEPRDGPVDERRIEQPREVARDAERAGIPGDVRLARRSVEPEKSELRRKAVRRVVADDDEAPSAAAVLHSDRIDGAGCGARLRQCSQATPVPGSFETDRRGIHYLEHSDTVVKQRQPFVTRWSLASPHQSPKRSAIG